MTGVQHWRNTMAKIYLVVTQNVRGFDVLAAEWSKEAAKKFKKEYCEQYPYDMVSIKEMSVPDRP